MNMQDIAQEIHNIAGKTGYSTWRIGLTHAPEERRKEHGFPQSWLYWKTDSLTEAQEIERFFIHEMGMKGGTGGNLTPLYVTYVYIF